MGHGVDGTGSRQQVRRYVRLKQRLCALHIRIFDCCVSWRHMHLRLHREYSALGHQVRVLIFLFLEPLELLEDAFGHVRAVARLLVAQQAMRLLTHVYLGAVLHLDVERHLLVRLSLSRDGRQYFLTVGAQVIYLARIFTG